MGREAGLKKDKLLGAVLLAGLLHGSTARAAPVAGWRLRVLTYNIHGIFPALRDGGNDQEKARGRYREIAARLRRLREEGRAPQVVVIQEVFNPWAAKAAREAGYPFVVEGNGPRSGKPLGSGLFILSEYPIIASGLGDYGGCTSFDCFANKGVLHARILVGADRSFDVYTTHMNADTPGVRRENLLRVRLEQIREFAAFVARTRDPKVPAVVAGDFNFRAGNEDYALFRSLTGAASVLEECARASCEGDPPGPILEKSVDHHFFLSGNGSPVAAEGIARTFTKPYHGRPLSDHWGLEAVYRPADGFASGSTGR